MIIKNQDLLSINPIREAALKIIEAGLESINTKKVIELNFKLRGDYLFIKSKTYDLTKFRRVFLVAFGKDAFVAGSEIKKILGEKLSDGVVLSLKNSKIDGLKTFQCTHPNTSFNNVEATKEVIKLIENTTEEDLIIVVISGGGSAMLTAPYKITYEDKALIAETLMNQGADINELNTVRKHLSEIKGGRLAALAYPSSVVTLIFSDVIGNDLSTIASGPTVIDHTTSREAEKILEKYKIGDKVSLLKLELTESPKDLKYFQKVDNFLVMDNTVATEAMEQKARNLGYSTRIYANDLKGQAYEIGKKLLEQGRSGEALIAAGETTVEISGTGVGGRNQELVLSNLKNLKKNQLIISVGTDGHDHSNFAGAIGDNYTLKKATEEKLRPEDFLANNDSYTFFKKIEEGIDTGLLESNVADLMLVLQDVPNN